MFPNLQAEMARHDLTGREMAKELNITEQSWYNKIKGFREWKLNEMEQIMARLQTEEHLEYIFKR